jgi:EAL domain-containing protein (putative c-di-GMP-specific phosphodiesterase class I)
VTGAAVELYYQPIVDLGSGAVVSLEALVRWRHPVRGLLSPAQFFTIAEETGASIEFGRQVLETITGHRRAWLDDSAPMADLPVAVNISARELLEPTLVDRFAELVDAGEFPPGHLIVEVAEPAIEADVGRAGATIQALHDLGVDLVVDDFGADWGSVTHLSRLQADYLKLEPGLVTETLQLGGDDRLLRGVVALCAELGIEPIAEGIKDPHQAEQIKDLGVRLGQRLPLQPSAAPGSVGPLVRSTPGRPPADWPFGPLRMR